MSANEAAVARGAALAGGAARVIDRAGRVLALLGGLGLVVLAARLLLRASGEPALDESGAWADDGWSRAAGAAAFGGTGLAALGLVRVPGGRRLLALLLLAVASLGIVTASRALDLVPLWGGIALATIAAPLALVVADERGNAARHALAAFLLGGLASGVLAASFLTLTALSGSSHVLDQAFRLGRLDDSGTLGLTAIRAVAVAAAMFAAWAPFHLALPELWGEGSAPLAGWLALVWPWIGWTAFVRLSNGLAPALDAWGLDAPGAVSLFLVLGSIVPAAGALAEQRAGRIFALLGIGMLTELLLGVHQSGVHAPVVTAGLWGYGLAWVVSSAALAGARARIGDDTLESWSGLASRLPRTALALAVAALLWAGLPGTFTLAARWQLWQTSMPDPLAGVPVITGPADAASPFALFAIAVGGILRLFVVARLLRVLYLRAPSAALAQSTPRASWRLRWGVVFLAALCAEFLLGLGPAAWRVPFFELGRIVVGG
jgi:formate hydrogenlyase subunit 3/multisubunit Na+/H+ antiporter MnhD subunit